MARKQSSGVIGAWAEAQRRQQRQREAEQRAWRAEQEQMARAQRAALRAQARDQREALRAYQQGREADAAARTAELHAQVTSLDCILPDVLAKPPFQLEHLMRDMTVPPFAPGPLAVPVPMPDQRAYQIPPPTGLRAFGPAARREHQEANQRAQAQFEHDWRQAAQAEEQRQRQLADYHHQYLAWADSERKRIMDHNGQVQLIGRSHHPRSPVCTGHGAILARGVTGSVICSAVAGARPESGGFPAAPRS